MSYYIKETVGDVSVEIGYNTLEELQARLRDTDPKCGPVPVKEEVNFESYAVPTHCEPEQPEEPKERLYLVY